ncbi:cytochrome P450 [Marasmius fiardii PR-910]|nr:cytochrome P450 [Marasmius fiardii PR-910]
MEIPPVILSVLWPEKPLDTYLIYSYLVHRAAHNFELNLPIWVVVSSYVLCLSIALTGLVLYKKHKSNRVAAFLGAASPPLLNHEDLTPGGVLTLYRAIKNFKTEYPAEALEKRVQESGYTLNLRILFQDRVGQIPLGSPSTNSVNRIITAEPEYLKAILATRFDDFEKGETVQSSLDSLIGTGVFNADGDLWRFHRSITRLFFSKNRISHFDIFDRHAEAAMDKSRNRLKEGYPVDFQDVVARFTLDSASEFLFRSDVGTLSGTLPYPHDSPHGQSSDKDSFARSFNEAQVATAFRSRFGDDWPLFEFWKDRIKEKMKPVYRFLEPILVEALKRHKGKGGVAGELKGDREVKEGETVLDHLVNYTDDHAILQDEILSLAVAGRDTTASILTFTVYMLSEHPQVLRRLREEILATIGPERRPTYDNFRGMKYLRAVLNEVLRLYPAVPFNMRQARVDTVLSGVNGGKPVYVPAKTRIIYSVFVMHRRIDLWGPDALEFDPDRFLDERLQKYLTPNPFIFLPFNAGPRICLGQQVKVLFSFFELLQKFSSISLSAEGQPPHARPPPEWKDTGGRMAIEKVQIKAHLTMYVHEGLWVTMTEGDE